MPSPIAHLAVGAWVAKSVQDRHPEKAWGWRGWGFCLFFSMAPDMDAFVGILMGDLGAYHNQATHSLAAGFLFCAALLPLAVRFVPQVGTAKLFGWMLVLYGIHLAMDWATYGRGLKLFWPWSETRFLSPVFLFYGLRWSDGVFSVRHLITAMNELVFAGFLFFAYRAWGWTRRPRIRPGKPVVHGRKRGSRGGAGRSSLARSP